MVDNSKIYFLDIETTGLSRFSDEILQLSIIDNNGDTVYNGYFKPEHMTSWPGAEAVNNISPHMVQDCPRLVDEFGVIQDILSRAHFICGYNVRFDLGFLEEAGFVAQQAKVLDVLMYARKAKLGLRNNSLTTVAEHFGFDYDMYQAHNALTDVIATKFVLDKLKAMGM